MKSLKKVQPRPYHHGDLRLAALGAAEKILEKEGVDALTLRAVARAVGVSHTAPKNHFGDLTGLLSELAAIGFQRFNAELVAAADVAGQEPRSRMKAMGLAYVGFARRHRGLFQLMFRSERLDMQRPSLQEAIVASRQALRAAAAARTPPPPLKPVAPQEVIGQAIALWSLVHGFAMLLLDGRLQGAIAGLPGKADENVLLDLVLTTTSVGGV